MAKIGQRAEHDFAGVKCGLLDQFSSINGKKDRLVWSDFRTYQVKTEPLGEDVCFLMCNTNARHALVDGAYNERRQRCEQGAAFFASVLDHPVSALRDVSWAEWLDYKDEMDEITAKRCAPHRDERVLSGIDMLRNGNLKGLAGWFESHDCLLATTSRTRAPSWTRSRTRAGHAGRPAPGSPAAVSAAASSCSWTRSRSPRWRPRCETPTRTATARAATRA